MKRLSYISGIIVLAAVSVASCERRSIYEEGRTAVPVIVQMDWRELGGDPTGATIGFYPENGSAPLLFRTNSVIRAQVEVPSGYYTVLVFNRTVDEYGTMHFDRMSALGSAQAILDYEYSSWAGTADSVGRTVYEPELIVCGRTDHFEVRERANGIIREHEDSRPATRAGISYDPSDPNVPDTVKVTPQRMVYTATFNVRVSGLQNVRSARAYITGMAGAEYLATRSATDTIATHVLEQWSTSPDPADYTKGYLRTTFDCFGLPEQYRSGRVPWNEHLYLQVLLVDGKTVITKAYDVGDLIEQHDAELELALAVGLETRPGDDPLILPDVEPEDGKESGFDVHFEDWGDTQDVIVPM